MNNRTSLKTIAYLISTHHDSILFLLVFILLDKLSQDINHLVVAGYR